MFGGGIFGGFDDRRPSRWVGEGEVLGGGLVPDFLYFLQFFVVKIKLVVV